MKILFFENENWEHPTQGICSRFNAAFPHDQLTFYSCPLTEKTIPQDAATAEIISVFIDSHITKQLLEAFPHLKLIVTRSTGFDHIDIDAAKKRNIIVCNAPVYASASVAEHTFALILALSRKLIPLSQSIAQTNNFCTPHIRGFELTGKTLGVIGVGNIGKQVIAIAKGFGMRVLAYDPAPKNSAATHLDGATCVPFNTLLQQSDIVTFHVPLTETTHHMFNAQTLRTIKKGAYIINTSRGGIIDTCALIQGLEEGIIAGAGLDVIEEEFYAKYPCSLLCSDNATKETLRTTLANTFLMHDRRVVMTPHQAYNSCESLERVIAATIETITQWQKGSPVNQIKKILL